MVYTRQELERYALSQGLDKKNAKQFAYFMKKRFPNESHLPYVNEWVYRWKTGKPELYADLKSKRCIKEAKMKKVI